MKRTEGKDLTEEQISKDEKIIKEYAPTPEELLKERKAVEKRVRRITKKHKLYVRSANGSLRRLDKLSPDIYGRIILLFLKGDGEQRYSKINKDVKTWQKLIPIAMPMLPEDNLKFRKLHKELGLVGSGIKEIVVSYNGSWKPLVRIYEQKVENKMEVKQETKTEK